MRVTGWLGVLLLLALPEAPGNAATVNMVDLDRSVVRIVTELNDDEVMLGTGFVINQQGHVVTNHHVVEGGKKFYIAVAPSPDKWLEAKLVWQSRGKDLAVLRSRQLQRPPVRLARPEGVQKYSRVLAIGFPVVADVLIEAEEESENVTWVEPTGTPGDIGRIQDVSWEKGAARIPIIQHSAAINEGNSGGPLFNNCGEVVGVNTASPAEVGAQGVFFASHVSVLVEALSKKNIPFILAATPCTDGVTAAPAAPPVKDQPQPTLPPPTKAPVAPDLQEDAEQPLPAKKPLQPGRQETEGQPGEADDTLFGKAASSLPDWTQKGVDRPPENGTPALFPGRGRGTGQEAEDEVETEDKSEGDNKFPTKIFEQVIKNLEK